MLTKRSPLRLNAVERQHLSLDLRTPLIGARPAVTTLSACEHGIESTYWSDQSGGRITIAEDAVNKHLSAVSGVKLTVSSGTASLCEARWTGPEGNGFDYRGVIGLFLYIEAGSALQDIYLRLGDGSSTWDEILLLATVKQSPALHLAEGAVYYCPIPTIGWSKTTGSTVIPDHGHHMTYLSLRLRPTLNTAAAVTVCGIVMECSPIGEVVVGYDGGYTPSMDFMAPYHRAYQWPMTIYSTTEQQLAEDGSRVTFAQLRSWQQNDFPVCVVSHGHSISFTTATTRVAALGDILQAKAIIGSEGFSDALDIFSPIGHLGVYAGDGAIDFDDILLEGGFIASRMYTAREGVYTASASPYYPLQIFNGPRILPDYWQLSGSFWEGYHASNSLATQIASAEASIDAAAVGHEFMLRAVHTILPWPSTSGNGVEEVMAAVAARIRYWELQGHLKVSTPPDLLSQTLKLPGPYSIIPYSGNIPDILRLTQAGAGVAPTYELAW